MPKMKHYIITSITLGSIALASALIIGLTNMVTRDKIAQNEVKKVNLGIASIFGDDSKVNNEEKTDKYKYVNVIYTVSASDDKMLGYCFKVSGSNMYGKISLLVGFSESSHAFSGVYMINDEQTYAQTLEENYVALINKGERNIDDVKCNATYGATLIKNMIDESTEVVNSIWKD